MKKYLFFLFLIISFYSCSQVQNEEKSEKKDYIVETKKFSDLDNFYFLEKSSKIEASSEVILSLEASWRVENIAVKEGDIVSKWQSLVFLHDSSANLNTNYKQSVLNLEQAKISYENNKISLDKNISDSEINLEKLRLNYENAKKTIEQDLIQAKDNLNNTDITNIDSKSSLDIQKIDNSIEKMEFDYNTQIKSNNDKIDSFILNLKKEKESLKNLIVNVINTWDSLFSVKNKSFKPSFYEFLWASNHLKKYEAEQNLEKLIEYNDKIFDSLNLEKKEDILPFIKELDNSYKTLKIFLDSSLITLNNSLVWLTWFTEANKNLFSTSINSYISAYEMSFNSFLANKNSIINFLNTYKDWEESIKKQIDLAKKDKEIFIKSLNSSWISSKVNYEKIVISSNDALSNLELQLKSAENTLLNSKQTRDITLKNLENTIKNAQLAVEKASIEVWKLILKSPISWQIAKIDLEVWQTYSVWSQALKIISKWKRELDVYVNADDINKINVWDKVFIDYKWEKFEAEVFSKSNIANETLNHKVKVSLNKDINLVWWIANVSFKLKSNFPLISLNLVNIFQSDNWKKIWEINILNGKNIEKKEVEFWNIYWRYIEIISWLDKDIKIILNDVSNFDSNKFDLKIQ